MSNTMEFAWKSMYIVGFCILISVIESSNALDCYSCNVSTSTPDGDACLGIGSVKTCPGSSVCLAASYEINSGIVKTYTTMQTCFPDMAGQECDNFIKSQRDLQRTATITPNTCYACHADNCNKGKTKPNSASSTSVGGFIVISTVLSLVFAQFIIL